MHQKSTLRHGSGAKRKRQVHQLGSGQKNSFKTELEKSRLRRESKGGQREEERFQDYFFLNAHRTFDLISDTCEAGYMHYIAIGC